MKTIVKSEEVLAYVCEACNTEYEFKELAENCEKKHVNASIVKGDTHNTKNSIYPDTVNIGMKNGEIVTYIIIPDVPEDIKKGCTNEDGKLSLALVDSYSVSVQKETSVDGDTVAEPINNVTVTLSDDGVLTVDIPDNVEIRKDVDTVCVKIIDKNDNFITVSEDNEVFKSINIIAEVKQTLENNCIESTDSEEATE